MTGVQTCALPISRAAIPLAKHALKNNVVHVVGVKVKVRDTTLAGVVDDDLFDHADTLPQAGRGVKMFFSTFVSR